MERGQLTMLISFEGREDASRVGGSLAQLCKKVASLCQPVDLACCLRKDAASERHPPSPPAPKIEALLMLSGPGSLSVTFPSHLPFFCSHSRKGKESTLEYPAVGTAPRRLCLSRAEDERGTWKMDWCCFVMVCWHFPKSFWA